MVRFHRLSSRLVLAMLLPMALLLAGSTILDNHYSRKAMISMTENRAMSLSQGVLEELLGILRGTRNAIDGVVIALHNLPVLDAPDLENLLTSTITAFPYIFGSTIALDPDVNGEHLPLLVNYRRDGDRIVNNNLDVSEYHYWERPGYLLPTERSEGVWIKPYFESASGKFRLITYARPLTFAGRKGVITVDIRLSTLSDLINAKVLEEDASVIVFAPDGTIAGHPQKDWIVNLTLQDLAEQQNIPELANAVDSVARGEKYWLRPANKMHEGVVGGVSAEPGRMYIRPLGEDGWGIATYFSDHTFLAGIDRSTHVSLAVDFVLLLLLALMLWVFACRALRPLTELSKRTKFIARGDFNAPPLIVKQHDEVGSLSNAFNLMQERLQQYISDLTQATAERERMAGELATAAQVHNMLLPAANPKDAGLYQRVAASLKPAAEVGGDLYYYKLLSGQRLVFVIGDVSDKGVPAALFLVRAMSALKAAFVQNLSPARVLEAVNRALVEGNDLCMFVTLVVGEVCMDTGECKMAGAGHEQPIKINNDGVQMLQIETGVPVGLEVGQQYDETFMILAPDDCLVVYTDGITEARNSSGVFFGHQRLLESLKAGGNGLPGSVLEHLSGVVDEFVGEAKQSDDMAMLVLKRRAQNPDKQSSDKQSSDSMTGEITYMPVRGCQNQIFQYLVQALEETPFDFEVPEALQLVVEELVTNVEKYAGLESSEECRVVWTATNTVLELHFDDPGIAVDPLKTYTPAFGGADSAKGGMGIELVKALTDGVRYSTVNGWNRMTVWFEKQG